MVDSSDGQRPRKRSKWDQAPEDLAIPPSRPEAQLPDWLSDLGQKAPGVSAGLKLIEPQVTQLDANRRILQVPEKLKAGLIGIGGHLINYIRAAAQSDIKIHNAPPGQDLATIVITGNADRAVEMIKEQLIGLQTHPPDDGEWTFRFVDVPQFLVPLVIGPGGKNLHEMMDKSGCLIRFVPASERDPTAEPGRQICRVKGPDDKLEYGLKLVDDQIELARRYHSKKHLQQPGGQGDPSSKRRQAELRDVAESQLTGETVIKRVFVGNLSFDTNWQSLKDHFSSAGQVELASVLKKPDGTSKGCGMVDYQTHEDAVTAANTLNNSWLDGRNITVKVDVDGKKKQLEMRRAGITSVPQPSSTGPSPHTTAPASQGSHPSSSTERQKGGEFDIQSVTRVFVGNLSYDTDWQSLRDHFSTVAPVELASVFLKPDRSSKGCGMVDFQTHEAAVQAANTLNNSWLDGRYINVKLDVEGRKKQLEMRHGGAAPTTNASPPAGAAPSPQASWEEQPSAPPIRERPMFQRLISLAPQM